MRYCCGCLDNFRQLDDRIMPIDSFHPRDFSPEIIKRIVYLDQFVISSFSNSCRPELQNQPGDPVHENWKSLLVELDRAVEMQLVACPYSPIHEDESLSAAHTFDALQRMYNRVSRGKAFQHYEWVQREQIGRCFEAWLRGDASVSESEFQAMAPQVLPSGVHQWDWNNVYFSEVQTEERMREVNGRIDAAAAEFSRVWNVWRANQELSSDEFEKAQHRSLARKPLTIYNEWVRSLNNPANGDELAVMAMSQPLMAALIPHMRRKLKDDGSSEAEAEEKVYEFFESDHVLMAPFARIQARMLRQLYVRHKEKRAGQEPPSRGMMNDIHMISTYLPYCDAAFIDNECYTLLSEKGGADVLKGYDVKIYCSRTRKDFLDYLRQVIDGCPDWHRATGQEKYGVDWPASFESRFRM